MVGGYGAVRPLFHGSDPTAWRTSRDFAGILGWSVGHLIWIDPQPFSTWQRVLANGFFVWRHSPYAGCSSSSAADQGPPRRRRLATTSTDDGLSAQRCSRVVSLNLVVADDLLRPQSHTNALSSGSPPMSGKMSHLKIA